MSDHRWRAILCDRLFLFARMSGDAACERQSKEQHEKVAAFERRVDVAHRAVNTSAIMVHRQCEAERCVKRERGGEEIDERCRDAGVFFCDEPAAGDAAEEPRREHKREIAPEVVD